MLDQQSWPAWNGEIVAVVASGPSAKDASLDCLRGRARVIAIKETVGLCSWADAVYGCDAPWWVYRNGLPEFSGLKMTWAGNRLAGYPDIRRVQIAMAGGQYVHDLIERPVGTVGSGGNSGFQAFNLAIQFGARRVLLVGFDMTAEVHWYGRNSWPRASNPTKSNFCKWIGAFEAAVPQLQKLGVEVVNTSMESALGVFPKAPLGQVLERWR